MEKQTSIEEPGKTLGNKKHFNEELIQHPIVEQKDTIKVSKNSKGFNYEFRLIAREGVNLLKRVDYVKGEMDKRIKKWTKK